MGTILILILGNIIQTRIFSACPDPSSDLLNLASSFFFKNLFYFLDASHSLQNLSSPSRDWSQATVVEVPSPNHWTAKEFPVSSFYMIYTFCFKTPTNLS